MNSTVDQELNIQPWRVVLFAEGEKYEALQKRLSRNELAALSVAELIRLGNREHLGLEVYTQRSMN